MKEILIPMVMFCAVGLMHANKSNQKVDPKVDYNLEAVCPPIDWHENLDKRTESRVPIKKSRARNISAHKTQRIARTKRESKDRFKVEQ